MKYSSNVIDKAMSEIKNRRTQAELINAQRLSEIEIRHPDIYKEEMSVRDLCFELSDVIFGKKGDPEEAVKRLYRQNEKSNENVRRMLKENGYPEDYLMTPYTCQKCKDMGTYNGYDCDCFKELLKLYSSQELSAGSNIKLHSFDEVRFDVYTEPKVREHMEKMVAYLKRYCAGFKSSDAHRSLYFYGSTGTGKTFLSTCVANELSSQGVAVCFGAAFDFFDKLEAERFGRAQGDTAGAMKNSDILIIDDLGSEFKTSFTESQLYNIINTRMNLELPTIVSSNLTSEELKARYNDRISSRLLGTFAPIPFNGGDIRLKLMKGRQG